MCQIEKLSCPIEAERRLAICRGWTNIYFVGGSWIGTPPDDAPNSRGQALVPRWARSWVDCGPLLIERLRGFYESREGSAAHCIVVPTKGTAIVEYLNDHENKNAAIQFAIVLAAIKSYD